MRNTIWSLIPPYVVFGLPFQIFVMRGFFRTIPNDLLDAARLDGASEFGCLRPDPDAPLPSRPGDPGDHRRPATWNELLVSLVLISSEAERTVPVGLLQLPGRVLPEPHPAVGSHPARDPAGPGPLHPVPALPPLRPDRGRAQRVSWQGLRLGSPRRCRVVRRNVAWHR